MTDQPTRRMTSWALEAEIEQNIDVQEEDSVRPDWWRASCRADTWCTTGSKPVVEDAAAEHIERDHPPCGASGERTFPDAHYCHLQPGHDGDHQDSGHTWPRLAICTIRARGMTCILPAGHNGLHKDESNFWDYRVAPDPTPHADPEPPASEPATPNSERIACIIGTCAWHLDVLPAPAIPPTALADLFGLGAISMYAENERRRCIERELEEHLGTHTVLEFATEIANQQSLNLGLIAQMRELSDAYRDLPARRDYAGLAAAEARAAVQAPRDPATGIITGI